MQPRTPPARQAGTGLRAHLLAFHIQTRGNCSPGLAPLDTLGKHLLLEGVLSSEAQGRTSKDRKTAGFPAEGPGFISLAQVLPAGPSSAGNRNTSRKVLCSRHPGNAQSSKPCPKELSSFCLSLLFSWARTLSPFKTRLTSKQANLKGLAILNTPGRLTP